MEQSAQKQKEFQSDSSRRRRSFTMNSSWFMYEQTKIQMTSLNDDNFEKYEVILSVLTNQS